jgi:hypothetical protein
MTRAGWSQWSLAHRGITEAKALRIVEVLNDGTPIVQALCRERSDGFAVFIRCPVKHD